MAFPIEKKLVIAVSSSALFDLSESNKIFEDNGAQEYKKFQEENIDKVLGKGVAFPFIKRFLNINKYFPDEEPVEVVLLSKNSATTGKRVFRSIKHYDLNITRAAFMEGKAPFEYIPAFNSSLFLSANEKDIKDAISLKFPAGIVLPGEVVDDLDEELRIAFDFDGVIADDEAETVNKKENLEKFYNHENIKSHIPHNQGPLGDLFKKLAVLQELENKKVEKDADYKRVIRISIVTARNAPAHERVITTLEHWGVDPNEVFFLGGMQKDRVLSIMKPHIFFDDQITHLETNTQNIPMVHIPFGIANN